MCKKEKKEREEKEEYGGGGNQQSDQDVLNPIPIFKLYLRGLEVLGELVAQLARRVDGKDPRYGDPDGSVGVSVLNEER